MNSILLSLLQQSACHFVPSDDVLFIYEPAQFYQTLLKQIRSANERVFLAALYIDPHQHELIQTMQEQLQSKPQLKLYFLLDCLRTTRLQSRGGSAGILTELAQRFPSQVRVFLYHTPALDACLRAMLPGKMKEALGVQHTKFYVTDNDILLSGANLSTDYFTDRQDRYLLVRNSAPLSEFYVHLGQTLGQISYRLQPASPGASAGGYVLVAGTAPDPVRSPTRFSSVAGDRLQSFLKSQTKLGWSIEKIRQRLETHVAVVPSVQAGLFGIRSDEQLMLRVLSAVARTSGGSAANGCECVLTTGYFNLAEAYQRALLASQLPCSVITASPQANGFLSAKDVSRYIPGLYDVYLKRFLARARAAEAPLSVYEYTRPNWTYHAKGLWCRAKDGKGPFVACIGSSNFGYRSQNRDLESQAWLFTLDPCVQQKLACEIELLHRHAQLVTPHTFRQAGRHVPPAVTLLSFCLKTLL